MRQNQGRRKAMNVLVTGLAILSTVVVVTPLVAILGYLIYKGASSLNFAFFTQIPKPVGENGGGMANSIVGSGVVLTLASLMGIPIGIAAGVYLAEFGRGKGAGDRSAVYRGCVERSAFDCDGHRDLCVDRETAAAFFGVRGRG